MHGTTILAIRKGNETVLAADGQVSIQHTIVKAKTNKLRKLNEGKVLAGFAGSTADAFLLFDLFEKKLKTYNGQLVRAAVELAKDWRSDKMLRRLEAQLLTADHERILLISGSGDVLEPDFDVHAIGSGGPYALAAGRALLDTSEMDAKSIAEKSLHIAADICIYTNHEIVIETL
jgi:ATP-dependent HslUV protease, peptidase subunit HslV